MPRETNASRRERAIEVCERLNRRYGPVECFLDHQNPFRLVISVLLSAQTTDAQVNKVTPELFRRWPTPYEMAGASVADVMDVIKSLGFYKTKAKHCVEAARMIVSCKSCPVWGARRQISSSMWALALWKALRWTRT